MKRTFILAALPILAIAGCQKATVDEGQLQDASQIRIVASLGNDATKTVLTDGGIGKTVKTSWLSSDQIGVYCLRHSGNNRINMGNNSRFDSTGEGATVVFSHNSSDKKVNWNWQNTTHTFYAYYPYNSVAGDDYTQIAFTVPSVQIQKGAGSTSHLASTDLLYSSAESMWNGNNGTNTNKEIDFQFNHALSVYAISVTSPFENQRLSSLRFVFADESEKFAVSAGTLDASAGEISVTEGSNEITLNVFPEALLSSTPSTFYIMGTPGHASKAYSVYATINGTEQLLAENRTINSAGIAVSAKAELSLSQTAEVETSGDDYINLSETETANCYLITKAGNYKFSAKYKGNGVIPTTISSIEDDPLLAPKSALVLWYNTPQTSDSWVDASPVDINSLSVSADGTVRFSTPETFVPGNAVIAVFAEEGVTYDSIKADESKNISGATLLWSWNIWAADGYDPEATAISAGTYKFMDRYVGAAISGIGTTGKYAPAGAVGNYYQWGRKDPIPAISDYTNYQPTTYSNILFCTPTYTPIKALQIDAQGNKKNVNGQIFGYKTDESGNMQSSNAWNLVEKTAISATNPATNKVYVGYSASHPYKLIVGTSQDGYYNSWLNAKESAFSGLWDSVKTIYDPCPAGWRVCTKDEATEFLTVVSGAQISTNNCGAELDGHYFPLNALRAQNNFCINGSVYSCGYASPSQFWTSTMWTSYAYPYAAKMVLPPNYASSADKSITTECSYVDGNGKALNVRCVKE